MLRIMKGDYHGLTRKQLRDVKLVQPALGGSRWQGIQHGELVDTLIDSIKELFGYVPLPASETYAVSPNETALIGGFSLGTPNPRSRAKDTITPLLMEGIPQETYQALGFQHSNDCRKALTVYCGGTVSLCTNGMVSAAHTMKHKHTSGLSLRDWLREGLEAIWEQFGRTGLAIQSLFEHGIRPQDHDKLMLRLARQNIIPWRLLGEVDEVWQKAAQEDNVIWSPEYEWGFDSNAWDWYNCVTHIAKKIPPALQFKALEDAFHLTCDLLPAKKRPVFTTSEDDPSE